MQSFLPAFEEAPVGLMPPGFATSDDDAERDRDIVALAPGIAFSPCAGIVVRRQAGPPVERDESARLNALLARIVRREEPALSALYLACAAKLFASALRIVQKRELAEEAVAATFLQAWNNAASFEPSRGSAKVWLQTILRSRALDQLRRERSRRLVECELHDAEEVAFADQTPQPCQRLEASEALVRLRRAMALLTPVQRQVLSLTFFEGHSQEEAATQIGLPLGTVKSHSRRGLAALRELPSLRAAAC